MSTTPSYNAKFYASLFSLTERRIQQLAQDGIIPRLDRGKYPLIETIKGYVSYLQNAGLNIDDDEVDGSYSKNRNKLVAAQAEAQELKNQVTRKELAPVKLLELILSDLGEQISSTLESVPLKVKRRLPHLKTSELSIIEREIKRSQNAASVVKFDWERIKDIN